MKTQLLLLSLSLIVSTIQLVAQVVCTPDPQYTANGVYPDSATGLPDAIVNVNYDQLITAVVPKDTSVVVLGNTATVTIDSIVVTNSNNPGSAGLNMPPGIIIASKTTPARFLGNSKDCMKMIGTVSNLADTGQYFLKVNTTTYVTVPSLGNYKTSQKDSIHYYSITVACVKINKTFTNVTTNGGNNGSASVTVTGGGGTPYTYLWSNGATSASISGLVAGTYTVTVTSYGSCKEKTQVTITQPPVGVEEINHINSFVLNQNIPNPFSGSTTISFLSVSKGIYDLKVYNILGAVVYNKAISAVAGENKITIDASRLPQGIYSYSLGNGHQTLTKRMIVAEKE